MKALKYRIMTEVNYGTEEEPDIQQIFSNVSMGWSEANEEIAKREAYNGEYTVEDVEDPVIPVSNEVSWDAMASAITEGVNNV